MSVSSERNRSSTLTADAYWILPFFLVLGAALTFFFWQVAEYTSLLG